MDSTISLYTTISSIRQLESCTWRRKSNKAGKNWWWGKLNHASRHSMIMNWRVYFDFQIARMNSIVKLDELRIEDLDDLLSKSSNQRKKFYRYLLKRTAAKQSQKRKKEVRYPQKHRQSILFVWIIVWINLHFIVAQRNSESQSDSR